MNSVLICVPSPRDIGIFHKSLAKLPYPKMLARYFPEKDAYNLLREKFLQLTYDTMILIPDDLIVYPEALEQLIRQHNEHPDDVISGICRMDAWKNKHKFGFRAVGDIGWYPREYNFVEYLKKYDAKPKYGNGSLLYRVEFNAFACMLVSRKIIEEVPFRFDSNGSGVDQNFCDDVRKKGYDCLVNVLAVFDHLAGRRYGHLESFMVGKKTPGLEFISPRLD